MRFWRCEQTESQGSGPHRRSTGARLRMRVSVAPACAAPAGPVLADDKRRLSPERLLDEKVVGASRYEQKSADVSYSPRVWIGAWGRF